MGLIYIYLYFPEKKHQIYGIGHTSCVWGSLGPAQTLEKQQNS